MTEQGAPRPGFFKRNWKWLVPVGCLTPLLCCGGGIAAITVGVFGALRNSPVYAEAFARASNDPEVIEAMGTPIAPRWWLSGSINDSGASGVAALAVPLSGPKAPGTLLVEAKKVAGTWQYETLQVATRGRSIDLLDRDAEPDDPDSVAEPQDEDVPSE